jgi:hypothetical protein
MLLISFHETVANLYAYDATGQLLNPQNPNVLNACTGYAFDELRGIYDANGYLYVLNGGKETSNRFAIHTVGRSHRHPFAMAFDNGGHAFVSNQDTNACRSIECDVEHHGGARLDIVLPSRDLPAGRVPAGHVRRYSSRCRWQRCWSHGKSFSAHVGRSDISSAASLPITVTFSLGTDGARSKRAV